LIFVLLGSLALVVLVSLLLFLALADHGVVLETFLTLGHGINWALGRNITIADERVPAHAFGTFLRLAQKFVGDHAGRAVIVDLVALGALHLLVVGVVRILGLLAGARGLIKELVSLALDVCDSDVNTLTSDGISLEAQLAGSVAGREVIAGAVPLVKPLVFATLCIIFGANCRGFALTSVGIQPIPVEATSFFRLIHLMSALTGSFIKHFVGKTGAWNSRSSSACTRVGILLVTSQAFLEAGGDIHIRGVLNGIEEVEGCSLLLVLFTDCNAE